MRSHAIRETVNGKPNIILVNESRTVKWSDAGIDNGRWHCCSKLIFFFYFFAALPSCWTVCFSRAILKGVIHVPSTVCLIPCERSTAVQNYSAQLFLQINSPKVGRVVLRDRLTHCRFWSFYVHYVDLIKNAEYHQPFPLTRGWR